MSAEANCLSRCVQNWFHRGKGTHSTAWDEVYFGTFEPFDGTCLIHINVEDHHRRLDWKIVNKFADFLWVGQCTSRTRAAHPRDVSIHAGPVKLDADAMEGAIRVKMSANGIGMKSNKFNVAKPRQHKL